MYCIVLASRIIARPDVFGHFRLACFHAQIVFQSDCVWKKYKYSFLGFFTFLPYSKSAESLFVRPRTAYVLNSYEIPGVGKWQTRLSKHTRMHIKAPILRRLSYRRKNRSVFLFALDWLVCLF